MREREEGGCSVRCKCRPNFGLDITSRNTHARAVLARGRKEEGMVLGMKALTLTSFIHP